MLCLGMLLLSQYALACHAVEHPYHGSQTDCEIFLGVQGLDQVPLDNSAQPASCRNSSAPLANASLDKPAAAVRAVCIRAPPPRMS